MALGETEHGGNAVANWDRRLRGVPHRQLFALGVPTGDDAAVFHRRRCAAVIDKAPLDQHIGLATNRGVVTFLLDRVRVEILRQVFVDQWRICI